MFTRNECDISRLDPVSSLLLIHKNSRLAQLHWGEANCVGIDFVNRVFSDSRGAAGNVHAKRM
jgi:hypothetical protein